MNRNSSPRSGKRSNVVNRIVNHRRSALGMDDLLKVNNSGSPKGRNRSRSVEPPREDDDHMGLATQDRKEITRPKERKTRDLGKTIVKQVQSEKIREHEATISDLKRKLEKQEKEQAEKEKQHEEKIKQMELAYEFRIRKLEEKLLMYENQTKSNETTIEKLISENIEEMQKMKDDKRKPNFE
eukprot:UN23434